MMLNDNVHIFNKKYLREKKLRVATITLIWIYTLVDTQLCQDRILNVEISRAQYTNENRSSIFYVRKPVDDNKSVNSFLASRIHTIF